MIIEWNEEITSGIEEIDLQHQHIISLLNQIVYFYESHDNSKKFIFTLLDFSEAIHAHFEYEEKLLADNGYKDLNNHKAGHEEISDLINSVLMPAMMNDEEDLPAEPLINIVRWFDNHLKTEDTRFFKSIKKSQGLTD